MAMVTTMKRTKSSSRFDTYYKLQWFDEISFAWKDIQKAYETPDAARRAMHDGKTWRIMEITETGRNELLF